MIIYRHRRLDTGEVFYIGISKRLDRPTSKSNRNKYWTNIVNKVGFSVEIIHTCDTWEDACELEQLLILEYGREDLSTGNLVNMTKGGEGTVGLIRTKSHKEKIGLGNKGKVVSNEVKNRISKSKNKKVEQFNLDGVKLKTFESTLEAERITGVHNPNISAVCSNKRRTAGGFIWKYSKEIC